SGADVTEATMRTPDGREVPISRPEQVLFPAAGISKIALVDYYLKASAAMLPYLRDRPLTLVRMPDGLDGPLFYEKKAPTHFPPWVSRVRVDTADGSQDQICCNDAATLAVLADQACVTPHTWLSRADDLSHPDQVV